MDKVIPKKEKTRDELARDVTPMPSYYKNWDNIDVEAEMQRIDNDENLAFDRTITVDRKGEKDYTGMTPEEIQEAKKKEFL